MRNPTSELRGRPFRRAPNLRRARRFAALALSWCMISILSAQDGPAMRAVLDRLDRLEKQNLELLNEIRSLREQLRNQKPSTQTGNSEQAPGNDAADPPAATTEQSAL